MVMFTIKITLAESVLSALVIRQIHRQSLEHLREQLASEQLDLLPDQLQKTLQPKIKQETDAIQGLENQSQLSREQQTLLESRRQNLQLYEDMLAGTRPVAQHKTVVRNTTAQASAKSLWKADPDVWAVSNEGEEL